VQGRAVVMPRRFLLWCGIVSSLFYVAINSLLPPLYPGYSVVDQTVSELFAIGAPTRAAWVPLGGAYAAMVIAFGWGVWRSAGVNRLLATSAVLVMITAAINLYWPPVHQRGTAFTLTDALHILWAFGTVFFMLLAIGFGAAALGPGFRRYSVATLVIIVVFTALTVVQGMRLLYGLPTPWIGVWERIAIGAFLLWVVVLASLLLRRRA